MRIDLGSDVTSRVETFFTRVVLVFVQTMLTKQLNCNEKERLESVRLKFFIKTTSNSRKPPFLVYNQRLTYKPSQFIRYRPTLYSKSVCQVKSLTTPPERPTDFQCPDYVA